MADTLDIVLARLSSLQNQIDTQGRQISDLVEQGEEIITKLDEINLPSGTGYSIDRES